MLRGNRPIISTTPPVFEPNAASGIDPASGTSWATGSYSTVESSTAEDYLITSVAFDCSGTAAASETELVIAVGAAASEVEKLVIPVSYPATTVTRITVDLPFGVYVPAGSRIACAERGANGSNHNRPQNVKVTLTPTAGLHPN